MTSFTTSILPRAFAATCLIACSFVQTSSAQDNETSGPSFKTWPAAVLYSLAEPYANTPGANDWSCQPSAQRPRPVVLVHGTLANRYNNWHYIAPRLADAGYCVYALNYGQDPEATLNYPGVMGLADMRDGAKELSDFVDQILAATNATQVDMVGHSQGGLMPRHYLKFEGGANPENPSLNKVHSLITFGAPHHGSTASGLGYFLRAFEDLTGFFAENSPAQEQQLHGSEFVETLNADGETVPGVHYVSISSLYDYVITPRETTFLTAGLGATVENVTLQEGCYLDFSTHVTMSTSPRVTGLILEALDDEGNYQAPCVFHSGNL
ncbi:esterase/lipase family protein [Marinobacter sp. SS21]|uniref:esterase/lipase family protein n=1 Tax=Marinobacter sp. SS21 TaxID=2979460 RepID=UPI00232FDD05|nr:alpha/beta fold hydrolase [Marinobacter sp. SS21]MDC0661451.1 alpha/beta fold hydrolase [Marinobacter sp. SS21]